MEQNIFEEVSEFPDPAAAKRFEALVGLDEIKARLIQEAQLLLNPKLLEDWSKKKHKRVISLIDTIRNRSPFFIFAGDVGAGKTALAENFSDPIARNEKIPMRLYKLSLSARGIGAVGQMTTLLTDAFQQIIEAAGEIVIKKGKPSSAIVLLIDEADALAQSRESDQMHHEDRAGVNALIRGIDRLAAAKLPAIVVMCTNRIGAIDPAIKRRAAEIFEFKRPSEDQCARILKENLSDTGIKAAEIKVLAKGIVTNEKVGYGCTFSDITQRLLPTILLDAIPDSPITFDQTHKIVKNFVPTPPFNESLTL